MGFGARLAVALARARTPLVLGIDPRADEVPAGLTQEAFLESLVDLAAEERLPAVKLQIAFFEAMGVPGIALFERLLMRAHNLALLAIADVKRGDIGSTAEAYAAAYFGSRAPFRADAITASPYLGRESLEPLVRRAADEACGLFVLARTSNPGAAALQAPILERVAALIAELNEPTIDESGYGAVGAVAGATDPEAAARLRGLLPASVLLAPGVGAQGGKPQDLGPLFDPRGLGALVPVSRGISGAWREEEGDWREACRAAIRRFRTDLAAVCRS